MLRARRPRESRQSLPRASRRDAGPTRAHQDGVNQMAEMQVDPEKTLYPAAPQGWKKSSPPSATFTTTSGRAALIHRGRQTTLQCGVSLLPAAGLGSFEKHKTGWPVTSGWQKHLSRYSVWCRQELQSKIETLGGCFAFRQQRTGAGLSTHSWGIAIDLNPGTNAQGSSGDMDGGVIPKFRVARIRNGRRLVRQEARRDAFSVLFGVLG